MPTNNPSVEAVALAGEMTGIYGDKALGRARMRLYAALNDRTPEQVDLLAQACHVLMQAEAQVKTGRDCLKRRGAASGRLADTAQAATLSEFTVCHTFRLGPTSGDKTRFGPL